MKLNIITACTRPHNLPLLADSIVASLKIASDVQIEWTVILDTRIVGPGATGLYNLAIKPKIIELFGQGVNQYHLLNEVLKDIPGDEWCYFLDDDNTLCLEFLREFEITPILNPDVKFIVFDWESKELNYKLIASHDLGVKKNDLGQFVFQAFLVQQNPFRTDVYQADGYFAETVGRLLDHKEIAIVNEPVTTHNAIYRNNGNTKETPPIYGYFHVAAMGNWKEVFLEILKAFNCAGLVTKSSGLIIGLSGTQDDLEWMLALDNIFGFSICYHGDAIDQYEFPTLQYLQNEAKVKPGFYYYVHTKGVSKADTPWYKRWREVMIDSVIVQHETQIAALKRGADVAGALYYGENGETPHFAGNFWWATSEHINRLPPVEQMRDNPIPVKFKDYVPSQREITRLQAEMWICNSPEPPSVFDLNYDNYVHEGLPGNSVKLPVNERSQICPLNKLGFDKIYCINLDRRPERWAWAQRQFAKIGLWDVKRFRAIDSVTYGLQSPFKLHPGEHPGSIAPGQVGCFLSHHLILQDALDNGYERILIFEDDVTFVNDFNAIMNFVWPQVPEDWELLYLGWTERRCAAGPMVNNSPYVRKPQQPWGTQAYAVQKEGIKILWHYLQTMEYQIDLQVPLFTFNKLNAYAIWPQVCPQIGTHKFESDVQKKKRWNG